MNEAVARPRSIAVHAALLAATTLTCVTASTLRQGFDPLADVRTLAHGVPFAATLLAILLVHESGHYLSCRWHGVRASLPYFLPAPPVFLLGTFGAFIRIRSRFPNRRALFDIGASGPWAGFVVALVASAVGLSLSTITTLPPEPHSWELGDSLLFTLLTRLVLRADPAHVVLHDVAFAGWVGLFVTSLNLLPAGQLDGGHVLYATAGRRTNVLPGILFGFLVWLGLRGQPIWFFWGAVVAIMMFLGHPPTQDDPRPLGAARGLASAGTLALFVLTFVPDPIRYVA